MIFRKKFDKYLTDERRLQVIEKLERDTHLCEVNTVLHDCRDPKDNKFLELAIDSNTLCIISGDKDLLVLHPFRNISILTPRDFVKEISEIKKGNLFTNKLPFKYFKRY